MNIHEFKKINKSIEKIFKVDSDLLFAIPWIQPVKVNDKNLIDTYGPFIKFNLINYIKLFFISIFEVLVTLFKLLKSIFIKPNKIIVNEKIIILSHLINIDNLYDDKDPYFGNLQNFFLKENYKCKKILINHIDKKFNKINYNNEPFVLPKIDCFKIEIFIFFQMLNIFFLLIKNSYKFLLDGINPFFLIIVVLKSLSYNTQSAIRIGIQIKNMLSRDEYHILFTTFEGHCFEKMIKKFNENIKFFAYQNTPLSDCQYSFHYYNNRIIPNIIFAKNTIYKKFLNEKYNFNTSIIPIGDLNYKEFNINIDFNLTKSILFIPEGIDYEVDLIKDYILKNSSNFEQYNLTIRFHPICSKKKINNIKNALQHIQNLKFSYGNDSDFENHSYVIYRGSSLIFKCIKHGLIPIYLDKNINLDLLKTFNLQVKYLNFYSPFNHLFLDQEKIIDKNIIRVINNNFYKPNFNKIKSIVLK